MVVYELCFVALLTSDRALLRSLGIASLEVISVIPVDCQSAVRSAENSTVQAKHFATLLNVRT